MAGFWFLALICNVRNAFSWTQQHCQKLGYISRLRNQSMDPLDRCVNSWSCSTTKPNSLQKMYWNLCQQLQVSCWLDQATLFLWLCWNTFHQMKIDFLFWPWFFSLDFFQNPSNWLASNLGWLHFPPISPPNLWGRPSGWTQLLDSSYSGQTAKQHLAELLDLWKNTRHSEDPEIF